MNKPLRNALAYHATRQPGKIAIHVTRAGSDLDLKHRI